MGQVGQVGQDRLVIESPIGGFCNSVNFQNSRQPEGSLKGFWEATRPVLLVLTCP